MNLFARSLAVTLTLLLLPSTASAQDSKAAAEALFVEGQSAMAAKSYDVACAKFSESVKISPGIGAMLWLGDCYEAAGKTASAWSAFRDAETAARLRSDPRRKVAERRARELEPKLARLTILVEEPAPGTVVMRDEVPVGSASLGTAVPVDPGAHELFVRAPGYLPWSQRIDVTAAGAARVVVPRLTLAPVTAPAPALPAPASASRARERESAPATAGQGSWPAQKWSAIVIGGIAVAGLGVGSAFGLGARGKLEASNENGHCGPGNACDTTGISLRGEAETLATLSTVAFVVSAAALAAATILFFTAPDTRPRRDALLRF